MIEKMKTLSLSSNIQKKEPLTVTRKSTTIEIRKKRRIPKITLDAINQYAPAPKEENIIPNEIKDKNITKIKRVYIKSFRGLKEIDLSIADNITLIAGRNGTCKSTILGIIAQCFSFNTDYSQVDSSGKYLTIPYKTLSGKKFISYAMEHFRLSEKHDLTGSMDINIEVYDATQEVYLDKLQLRLTQEVNKIGRVVPRSRVRNNQDTDRAVTHPVIYLGLKRMFPISERKYEEKENEKFIQDNIKDFLKDNNNILVKNSSQITTTVGIVNSIVAHSEKYDHQSVSVGEDNIGQILQAIYSFKKLKKEMGSNYKGGIFLIDEIDASLFCAAQIRLLDLLEKYSKDLQLQIIITSHSIEIMERLYKSSQRKEQEGNFKVHYLTNAYGKVKLLSDINKMKADIKDCIPDEFLSPPKTINVYTEDQEARDFLHKLCKGSAIEKKLNILTELYIGCQNYKRFIEYNIPEFTQKSLIVLDGDNRSDEEFTNNLNAVCLPTKLPPDQLLFEYLLNKDEEDPFWEINEIPRSTIISLRVSLNITARLDINTGEKFKLAEIIHKYRESNKGQEKPPLRKLFKKWYQSPEIQLLIKDKLLYEHWLRDNQQDVLSFLNSLQIAFQYVQKHA
ncbi:AAA family ATPase [Aggregatibacter segnis]|uniref:AAA family ATPase n=1 Tax=Aggregatibacter segnis TaxID=739 RepID=UPI003FA02D9A